MKPSILKWIYVALGFLVLTNTLLVVYHPIFISSYSSFFDPVMPTITANGNSITDADRVRMAGNYSVNPLDYPIFPVVIVIASIVVIVGLIKMASWSRIAAYIVIAASAIECVGMHMFFVLTTELSMADLLRTFIVLDILLLFLAYKIYTSAALKVYLSRPS